MTDDIAELVRDLRIWEAKWHLPPEHVCVQAAAALERLQAERDAETKRANEQTDLATKSMRRLAELAEPGAIGAFASRDHWKVRAEAAEAQLEMSRSEHHELCRALDAERDPEIQG